MAGLNNYADLLPPLSSMIQAWLKEDIPSFDVGGFVVGNDVNEASLFIKSPGVVAGVPFFDAVFEELKCKVTWKAKEGDYLDPGPGGRILVATVTGPARNVLMGERLALNILCRASGIASKTKEFCDIKVEQKWAGKVAGTRKITPGFRLVEKHAMLVGGSDAHRMDLSSMVMLKDNHIWSHGSITNAVKKARQACGFSMKIEVECGTIGEAREAIAAGADVVMLDNFTPDTLKETAKTLKGESPHVIIEGSGGITKATIGSYMGEGVDILSTSAIHQGVPHIDFSLKINH